MLSFWVQLLIGLACFGALLWIASMIWLLWEIMHAPDLVVHPDGSYTFVYREKGDRA